MDKLDLIWGILWIILAGVVVVNGAIAVIGFTEGIPVWWMNAVASVFATTVLFYSIASHRKHRAIGRRLDAIKAQAAVLEHEMWDLIQQKDQIPMEEYEARKKEILDKVNVLQDQLNQESLIVRGIENEQQKSKLGL